MPLSFYGLGSIKSILSLKMFEIKQLALCLNDEDIRKVYYGAHGIPVES